MALRVTAYVDNCRVKSSTARKKDLYFYSETHKAVRRAYLGTQGSRIRITTYAQHHVRDIVQDVYAAFRSIAVV